MPQQKNNHLESTTLIKVYKHTEKKNIQESEIVISKILLFKV